MDGWFSREFWQVFWASLVPLTELRGSIPLGIGLYRLSPLVTLVAAVLGSLVPVTLVLLFLEPVTMWLRRVSRPSDRFFAWLFAHTYRRHPPSFERWGSLGLLLYVAITVPPTGGWSAAILAYLLGIKFWPAFINISLGIIISGVIVTVITLGGVWAFSH